MSKNGTQFTSAPILFVTERKKMKEFGQPYKRAWAVCSPFTVSRSQKYSGSYMCSSIPVLRELYPPHFRELSTVIRERYSLHFREP